MRAGSHVLITGPMKFDARFSQPLLKVEHSSTYQCLASLGSLPPPPSALTSSYYFQSSQSVLSRSSSDFTFLLTAALAFCLILFCFFFSRHSYRLFGVLSQETEEGGRRGTGFGGGCLEGYFSRSDRAQKSRGGREFLDAFAFGGSCCFAWNFSGCRRRKGASF